jgi:hypothetical protein
MKINLISFDFNFSHLQIPREILVDEDVVAQDRVPDLHLDFNSNITQKSYPLKHLSLT